jgi:GNAT superfamily N-acetyltransferase
VDLEIRRAGPDDVTDIAEAHRDSIHSIGPLYYEPAVVAAWAGGLRPEIYLRAMARGEVFFMALDRRDEGGTVLGFSSHRIDDGIHGTAVYVRGGAARQGVGTALFQAAEASALAAGATTIEIASSLAAVHFWAANGFEETGRGEQPLRSGAAMPCVFMRKTLGAPRP